MPFTSTTKVRLRRRKRLSSTKGPRCWKSQLEEMATIDVVPLDSNVPTPDKVDSASEAILSPATAIATAIAEQTEGVETSRKRLGRPSGAKDVKRRKTPVRRKRGDGQSTPPVIEEPVATAAATAIPTAIPPAIAPAVARAIQPAIQPAEVPESMPAIQPAIQPKELFRHRMEYHQQKSALESHWDSIISPMFHNHQQRIY